MKITSTDSTVTRTGSVVVLITLLIPLIIALVAFAVDYGVIVVARQELQNAADTAATATLSTLQSDSEMADLAASEAITGNNLLGSPIDFDMERAVHYGTWDQETQTFTEIPREGSVFATDVSGASIPSGANAVKIRLTRSRALGNGIQLFFAPVIGTNFADIEVEAIATGTPGCSGFFGIEFFDVSNNARTDSYNSDNGDYNSFSNRGENGDTCSNGAVTVRGGHVLGDAAGSSVFNDPGRGGTISGNETSRSSNRTFDPVDFSEANINDNDLIPDPPQFSFPPQFLDSNNDLIIGNGRNIVLESGVYRVRDLLVRGGSRLEISGEVTIFVERRLELNNGTDANPSRVPGDFQLFVGSGPVILGGGNDLHGVIYAPQADVTIDNGVDFFGSIIGKSLTVRGSANLHFDEALAEDEESGGAPRLVF